VHPKLSKQGYWIWRAQAGGRHDFPSGLAQMDYSGSFEKKIMEAGGRNSKAGKMKVWRDDEE